MKKYITIIFTIIFNINTYAYNNIMVDVDTCSITIHQNDTTIYSNTPIQFHLSTNQGADYYHWYPSIGLSDTNISNPVANISSSTQYILEAIYLGNNLVYNGDFSLGNVGFTTQYTIDTYGTFDYGNYNIVANASTLNPGFTPCVNGGNYMAADGSTNSNTIFYQQMVSVELNTDYVFSIDLLNICSTSTPAQLPQFKFLINSQQIGNIYTVNYTNCNWNRFYQTWNSGNNTTATITILDQNTIAGGNDFAIDNISLKKICKAYDTIKVTILPTLSNVDTCSITIHQNDTTIYSITPIQFQLSSNQEADYYHWYPSTGLSDTTISNPVATISSTSQYILEAMFISDSNLVYNGDFELGNTGFATDYNYETNPNPVFTIGDYNIVTNTNQVGSGFLSCENGGLFFVTDASTDVSLTLYKNTANVEPNTDYLLSYESTTMYSQSPADLARLQGSINSQQVGNILTVSNTNCTWNHFSGIWNSGTNTTATIRIKDQNSTAMGNDFAIDNISLRKICKAYDTINIVINNSSIIPREVNISLCENDFPYTYYDSVYTQAGTYGYSFTTNNIVDSLHIVHITLLPLYIDTIFASICSGQTYTENGFNVKDAGFYTNTLITINGCDSIINLLLNVQSIEDTIINAVICEGKAYNNYGFNESNSGTYYNYYSFGEECERKVILNLTVIEYPEMLLLPDSVVEVEKYPIKIDATCLGCDSYIWSNGVLSPLINIYSQGTYYICVESSCGSYCDSVVIINPDVYVFLPNSFTPLESTNNIFRYYTAKDDYISIDAFQIFNRWGEKIFETNQKNMYWNGKYKGNYCQNGVYVWRLLYKTIFTGNQIFEKTGEVNLIK